MPKVKEETIHQKIARLTNASQSYVSKLLSGKRRPSYDKAKAFAEATNTTKELWLEGSPEQIIAAVTSALADEA